MRGDDVGAIEIMHGFQTDYPFQHLSTLVIEKFSTGYRIYRGYAHEIHYGRIILARGRAC